MPELSSNFKNEHEVHFTSSYITLTTADAGDPSDPVCSETKQALFVLKYNPSWDVLPFWGLFI